MPASRELSTARVSSVADGFATVLRPALAFGDLGASPSQN